MADTVTRVTRQSWGSRIKRSFGGVVFGFVLLVVGFVLLFTNEGRAVRRHRALQQGARDVVAVSSTAVDPANEGRLVHLSGVATTTETLRDPQFGVSARAIHLERNVEMYQWIESESSETRKKVGGSTETTTTYSYRRGWSDRLIDSSGFAEPAGHQNPGQMPYSALRLSADNVTLGAFRLSDRLIQRLDRWSPLAPTSTGGVPGARLGGGGIYVGFNPSAPRIGDVRVTFRQVQPDTVSVVAKQEGNLLASYPTRSGALELVQFGQATADEMFTAAVRSNRATTWFLRSLGYVLLVFGLSRIMRPLSVLADVIPVIGNLVGRGTGALAFGCALPMALVTIAVAWFVYRPLLALAILVPAIALGGTLLWRSRRGRSQQVTPPPPPPPPAPA